MTRDAAQIHQLAQSGMNDGTLKPFAIFVRISLEKKKRRVVQSTRRGPKRIEVPLLEKDG